MLHARVARLLIIIGAFQLSACGGGGGSSGNSGSSSSTSSVSSSSAGSSSSVSSSSSSTSSTSSSSLSSSSVSSSSSSSSSSAASTVMGRATRVRYDFDNNGTFEGERIYTYDANGRVLSGDYTYTDDGVTDTDFRSFSIAPKGNEQVDVVYGADGRVQHWLIDSSDSAADFAYVWKSDGRLNDATLTITAKALSLTTAQDLAFNYNTGNLLTQWMQTGSVTVLGIATTTTITTDLSYTGSVLSSDLGTTAFSSSNGQSGSSQTAHQYTWTASGKLDLVRVTDPSNPTYLSQNDYQYDGNDRLTAYVLLPDDPADNATWNYFYDGTSQRITTWTIDMASNGSTEAHIEIEWESGACQIVYAWAPRARPNFVAMGHAPHIPGTGIFVLSPCVGHGVY